MRIILMIVAAVIVFVGTIVAALALTGRLNADTLSRLTGGETIAPAVPVEHADAGPLTTKIKEEQERLSAWEADLQKREKDVEMREQNVDQMLAEVAKQTEVVNAALGQADAEHTTALQGIAKTLEKMDPKKAAAVLEEMEPTDAAKITPLMSDRMRAQIFDEMDEKKRSALVEMLQKKKL